MEKKLTDEEIVKALECCVELDCNKCPIKEECCDDENYDILLLNALDLIRRQKAEIERLTSLYDGKSGFMTSSIGDLPLTVDGLRKAVDEIARLYRVQAELQEYNEKNFNDAKDLRRKNADLQKEVERLTEEIKSIKAMSAEQVVESEKLKKSIAEAVNSFVRLETLYKVKCKELEITNKKLEELKGGKID